MFRFLILIAIVVAIFSSCSSLKKASQLNVIELCYDLSFLNTETGKVFRKNDSMRICFFENIKMYCEPYTYTQYNRNSLKGDTVIMSDDPSTISYRARKYIYYVFENGAETGLQYDSLSAPNHKIVNVDSIQKRKAFKEAKLYNLANDRFTRAIWVSKKILKEEYVNINKPDESYNDTSYFYFSKNKFKDIDYSLSKEADSLKKMKLVQVNLIYKAIPKGAGNKLDIPRREIVFKIKVVRPEQPDKLLALFERFKKDGKTLNLK